ncbi:uncharacterized protein LOC133850013 [Drosophila sulfurigaster albostrigata]|uniref:uncharacterized protein LOC133850013 n=1 Tax=Drosophila sulfurigaster albostrigata TaxID=89887 RepID=UPI002D21A6EB|nr:uncharacterized protein LOC133850013 [Drosophila sulfurigaster albostrigata]
MPNQTDNKPTIATPKNNNPNSEVLQEIQEQAKKFLAKLELKEINTNTDKANSDTEEAKPIKIKTPNQIDNKSTIIQITPKNNNPNSENSNSDMEEVKAGITKKRSIERAPTLRKKLIVPNIHPKNPKKQQRPTKENSPKEKIVDIENISEGDDDCGTEIKVPVVLVPQSGVSNEGVGGCGIKEEVKVGMAKRLGVRGISLLGKRSVSPIPHPKPTKIPRIPKGQQESIKKNDPEGHDIDIESISEGEVDCGDELRSKWTMVHKAPATLGLQTETDNGNDEENENKLLKIIIPYIANADSLLNKAAQQFGNGFQVRANTGTWT